MLFLKSTVKHSQGSHQINSTMMGLDKDEDDKWAKKTFPLTKTKTIFYIYFITGINFWQVLHLN